MNNINIQAMCQSGDSGKKYFTMCQFIDDVGYISQDVAIKNRFWRLFFRLNKCWSFHTAEEAKNEAMKLREDYLTSLKIKKYLKR